jgi:phage-related minor tail protein
MAFNQIKGLTVEIGGDTTKLGKALEDVNKKSKDLSSELGQVNRMLKMDPGNADLLAQKQEILADAVTNTAKKLETLKEAERQVQQQFERGEVSEEQVRALQREIIETERKLQSYKNAVDETAEEIDNLGEKSRAAKNASEGLGDTLDNIANTGLATLGGLVTAAAGALTAAAESTREYRTDMAKLDTAFQDNGHSVEAAQSAYKELQSVLGDSAQSVEAANHLAKLTDNEKDLATWTGDILPGVFATFGASLPIEGLTEAANETAKVGQVTGPLADALNWAGVSEDAFNESLAKCNSEQERQQLIMETLSGLYGEASENYKETNADVIAANKANEEWTASLAEVGAAVEPVLTKVKEVGAELLGKLVPVIETLLANLPTVAVVLGGIAAALVSYKVAAIAATAAEKGMTLAQYAAATAQKVLNAAMSANPIGLIIVAITALVAAFTYLWQNSEKFREFWIGLWEGLKKAVSAVVDWIKENWQAMLLFLINPLAGIFKYCYDHFDGFRETVDKVIAKVKSILSNMIDVLKQLPSKIWNAIVGAVQKVKTWGSNLISEAKASATNMLNNVTSTLKQLPSKIWNAIVGAVTQVANWGSNMVSKAKSAMSNVVSSVTNTLKSLPSKVLSIGGNLVTGLWNGVSNKLAWLKQKISGFASSVLSSIKSFFGVHSPSTETAWIGEMLDQGLAKGVLDNADQPIDAMHDVTGGVLGAAQTFDGMSVERGLQRSSMAAQAAAAVPSGLADKLDRILAAIERGQVLTIDKKQLIGGTADDYDTTLGQRRALVARGAL